MFYAVASVWERSPTEGAGDTYLSPASQDAAGERARANASQSESNKRDTGNPPRVYQPAALFPSAGGSQWGAGPPAYHDPWLLRYTEGGVAVSSEAEQARAHSQEQQGRGFESLTATYPIPEHSPMWAAILDPGFTLPTPAPPPEPLVAAAGALTEGELRAVLTEAGWPVELHDQAVAIVHCESRFRPDALGDGGRSGGLFQLNIATWFRYAGEDASQWHDPLVNARTAWATYQYDIGRGYEPWRQWSCRKVLD